LRDATDRVVDAPGARPNFDRRARVRRRRQRIGRVAAVAAASLVAAAGLARREGSQTLTSGRDTDGPTTTVAGPDPASPVPRLAPAELPSDATGGRYVPEGESGLAEIYHDERPADASIIRTQSKVCRSREGTDCYTLAVSKGDGYDAAAFPLARSLRFVNEATWRSLPRVTPGSNPPETAVAR
jgi:hypothetical protein